MIISRRKALLLALPIAALLAVVVPVYWLLHTASGAAWLWDRVERLDAADVSASRVTGDLAGGFVIQDLAYRSDALELSVRRLEIRAGAGWWPLAIEVRKLALLDTEILIHASEPSAEDTGLPPDAGDVLAALKPPVPVSISEAVLSNIRVMMETGASDVTVESVGFALSLDRRLVVDHLHILAAGLETDIEADLELTPPFALTVDADGRLDYAPAPGAAALELPFRLQGSGDLARLELGLTSEVNGLQVDGEIANLLKQPRWNLTAKLDRVQFPEAYGGPGIALSETRLAGHGDTQAWSFDIDTALQADRLTDARAAVAGTGTADGIEITDARLTGAGLDVSASGKLDWSGPTQAAGKTVISQLDVSPWVTDWPAGERLAGELELDWSETGLQIRKGHLGIAGRPAVIDLDADIDTAADLVSARLEWRDLAWPPAAGKAEFSSRSGRLDISGSMADWRASGQVEIQAGDYPRGRFEIDGGGGRTSARIVIAEGEVLGGVIRGEAGADWSANLEWDAVINVRGIDPGPVLGEWPGKLDGDIRIISQDRPQRTRVEIAALEGQLRGVPLSARGGVEITGSGLAFESLGVQTDKAVLKLDGAMMDPAGVRVDLDGELPSMLLQGASGKVQLQGRYSDVAARKLLDLQVRGQDLAWNGLALGTLAVSMPAATGTEKPPSLQLEASSLAWENIRLDELSASLNRSGEQYELDLMLTDDEITLKSLLLVTPENGGGSLAGKWRGVLSLLDLDVGPAYSFGLLRPVPIVLSSGAYSMAPVCLAERAGPSLCLDFDFRQNGDWTLVADADAIPLDYLRDYFELDVHFEQTLVGHMEWRQLHDQPPTGGAELQITAGRILDLLDNEVLASTSDGRFAFSLRDGNLESGVLEMEFPGTGFVDVDFDVRDIAMGGEQAVHGRAVIRLDKLALLGQMALPGVDAVDGQFESDIQIGGSLGNPELDGGFRLANGLVEYAPVGLRLEDIDIRGRVHRRDQGDFKGSFRAGEGFASFDGRFLFDDAGSPQLNLDLAGGPLLLVNTDALKITSEQQLRAAFTPDRVDISGQITIPRASLTSANLQFEEVRDSEDLVIESHGAEASSAAAEPAGKSRIYGQLEVTLGDDVSVKVPGIETKITGSTKFAWNGDSVPMAEGNYKIHGRVDVYGPTLRIDNGTVSFPGVPANNPLLNIRAGRDIYGNTQIRSAGVQVIGSLKRPVLEAYTVPITNEDRAWTLLVTGTDFDQAQGVSGFDLGTYIAPRLYVSYGISLFEDENVISARYDLKKGFGVKVTSGQRETGLDVSYTINR